MFARWGENSYNWNLWDQKENLSNCGKPEFLIYSPENRGNTFFRNVETDIILHVVITETPIMWITPTRKLTSLVQQGQHLRKKVFLSVFLFFFLFLCVYSSSSFVPMALCFSYFWPQLTIFAHSWASSPPPPPPPSPPPSLSYNRSTASSKSSSPQTAI